MPRCWVLPLLSVPIFLCAAAPGPRTTRLLYDRRPGAEQCPDEAALRGAIAVRIGSDPFEDNADLVARATVEAQGTGLLGRVEIADLSGHSRGRRELTSPTRDCRELAAALELALSLAIDPLSATRAVALENSAQPAPALVEPPREALPVSTQPVALPPVERSIPPSAAALLGSGAVVGALPSLSTELVVGMRLRWPVFSMALEAEATLPRTQAAAGGSLTASTVQAQLLPCLSSDFFAGCLVASVGTLRLEGQGLANPRKDQALLLAAGARIAWEHRLTGPLAFRAFLDLLVPLTRTTVTAGGQEVWSTPVLNSTAGLALVWTFETDSSRLAQ